MSISRWVFWFWHSAIRADLAPSTRSTTFSLLTEDLEAGAAYELGRTEKTADLVVGEIAGRLDELLSSQF